MTIKKWRSPDSSSVGVHLAAALQPHAHKIAHNGCLLNYTSDDMGKGMNVPMLTFWACILAAGMKVDPRGGYFKQKDCEEVFGNILTEVDIKAQVECEARSRLLTMPLLLTRGADVSFREE